MRAFADTNVIVYAQSDDGAKTATAIKLLETGPIISAQVVNETVAILTRKYGFSLTDAHQVATSLLVACEVMPVEADTIREAIRRDLTLQAFALGLADCKRGVARRLRHAL